MSGSEGFEPWECRLFLKSKNDEAVEASHSGVGEVVEALGDPKMGVDSVHQSRDVRTTPREMRLAC